MSNTTTRKELPVFAMFEAGYRYLGTAERPEQVHYLLQDRKMTAIGEVYRPHCLPYSSFQGDCWTIDTLTPADYGR